MPASLHVNAVPGSFHLGQILNAWAQQCDYVVGALHCLQLTCRCICKLKHERGNNRLLLDLEIWDLTTAVYTDISDS